MYSHLGANAHPVGRLINDGGWPGIAFKRSELLAPILGTDFK